MQLSLLPTDGVTSCGTTRQRLVFSYHPTAAGYDVKLFIERYTGRGSYTALTTDIDSPSGVKFWVHSVGAAGAHLVRGLGTAGTVEVESAVRERIVGTIDVDVWDAAQSDESAPPVRMLGRWACNPSAPSHTPAVVPIPTPSAT